MLNVKYKLRNVNYVLHLVIEYIHRYQLGKKTHAQMSMVESVHLYADRSGDREGKTCNVVPYSGH